MVPDRVESIEERVTNITGQPTADTNGSHVSIALYDVTFPEGGHEKPCLNIPGSVIDRINMTLLRLRRYTTSMTFWISYT